MQLEGQPRNPNQPLALQLFDSDRVDIAPGSNVVREDDQVDGQLSHLLLRTIIFQNRFLPHCLTLRWQYGLASGQLVNRRARIWPAGLFVTSAVRHSGRNGCIPSGAYRHSGRNGRIARLLREIGHEKARAT
jgi:hypothetical protein